MPTTPEYVYEMATYEPGAYEDYGSRPQLPNYPRDDPFVWSYCQPPRLSELNADLKWDSGNADRTNTINQDSDSGNGIYGDGYEFRFGNTLERRAQSVPPTPRPRASDMQPQPPPPPPPPLSCRPLPPHMPARVPSHNVVDYNAAARCSPEYAGYEYEEIPESDVAVLLYKGAKDDRQEVYPPYEYCKYGTNVSPSPERFHTSSFEANTSQSHTYGCPAPYEIDANDKLFQDEYNSSFERQKCDCRRVREEYNERPVSCPPSTASYNRTSKDFQWCGFPSTATCAYTHHNDGYCLREPTDTGWTPSTRISYENEVSPSPNNPCSTYNPSPREPTRSRFYCSPYHDSYRRSSFEDFVCKASKKHATQSTLQEKSNEPGVSKCEQCCYFTSEASEEQNNFFQRPRPRKPADRGRKNVHSDSERGLIPRCLVTFPNDEDDNYHQSTDRDNRRYSRSRSRQKAAAEEKQEHSDGSSDYFTLFRRYVCTSSVSDLPPSRSSTDATWVKKSKRRSCAGRFSESPKYSHYVHIPCSSTPQTTTTNSFHLNKGYTVSVPDHMPPTSRKVIPDFSQLSLPVHPETTYDGRSYPSLSCEHIPTAPDKWEKRSTHRRSTYRPPSPPRTSRQSPERKDHHSRSIRKRAQSFHAVSAISRSTLRGQSERYSDPSVRRSARIPEQRSSSDDATTDVHNVDSESGKEEYRQPSRFVRGMQIQWVPATDRASFSAASTAPPPSTGASSGSVKTTKPASPSQTGKSNENPLSRGDSPTSQRNKQQAQRKIPAQKSSRQLPAADRKRSNVYLPFITSLKEEGKGGPWHATVVARGVEYDVSATMMT